MKLKGNFAGDMTFHGAKRYGETGTRMAKVTFAAKVQEDVAKDKCGADFHRVAFGGMTVQDGLTSHACGAITKPNLVVEMHEVEILGTKVKVAPEIPKIVPVEDEPAVTVHVVMPIEVTELRKEMFGELTCSSGDFLEMTFEPIQMDLPGMSEGMTVKRKDGAFGNPTPQLVEA